jgi:hypothetical protein
MSMNQFHLPDEDDNELTIPPMGTVTVKRLDLGLNEINTGQYFMAQSPYDTFQRLPISSLGTAVTAIWQVELGLDGLSVPPLRLEVAGPVVIGRGQDVDVSLSDYDALHYGISRRHAMLRPSKQALYFIELGSRNGSRINGIEVGPEKVHNIALGDVIRLGTLTLVVRYLQQKG